MEKLNKKEVVTLLRAIMDHDADGWAFAGCDEKDISGSYEMLEKYDTDADANSAVISWLNDCRDLMEDIPNLVNLALENVKLAKAAKINRPEAFYTGGGIWISAMWTDKLTYYTVSNDWPYCLTLYDNIGEDEEGEYCFQNMVWSKDASEFTDEDRRIYGILKAELDKTMF